MSSGGSLSFDGDDARGRRREPRDGSAEGAFRFRLGLVDSIFA